MSTEWYLLDASGQYGPFGIEELRHRLESYASPDVLVWRDGFLDWKRPEEAFAASAVSRPRSKGRWALYGAALGLAACLADAVLQWRGRVFMPWEGVALTFNLGYASAQVGLPALAFFVAGAIRDVVSSRGAKRATVMASGILDAGPTTPPAHASSNFIVRNWYGEFPLWKSYWVFAVIGSFVVSLVLFGVREVYRPDTGFYPPSLFAFVAGIWLATLATSVWQVVGVWRSANVYAAEQARAARRAPWAVVAKVMMVIGVVRFAVVLVQTGVPQVVEIGRVAFLGDPDIPGYSIRVMRNGSGAEISGGIKYGLANDFRKILQASPQLRVVHLNSIGGRIGEGEALYELFRANRLTTYVSASCYSACTVAFSGGAERVLREGAVLGFHRGTFAGKDEQDTREMIGQRKVFSAAGYSPEFISRALATPNASVWTPTVSELLDAKVITKTSDGSDFALSGMEANVSKDDIANSLIGISEIYVAIRDRFPDQFKEMVNGYYEGYLDGSTEADLGERQQDQFASLVASIRSNADDDVLVDFGSLLADRIAALRTLVGQRCFDFAVTGSLDVDSRASLSPELVSRGLGVHERIIRTATVRPRQQTDKALWEKLVRKLAGKGVTRDEISQPSSANTSDSSKRRYCDVKVVLYREIVALPQAEAAMLMRSVLAMK